METNSTKYELWEGFSSIPIIGILRGISSDDFSQILTIYQQAGLQSIEVTMNTPAATDLIKQGRLEFPSLFIGAGTVTDLDRYRACVDAGAQFIVTPNVNLNVIEMASNQSIPIICGALTPTEIVRAYDAGANAIKLFPASLGGPAYLKSIAAPLDHIPFIPTGGVHSGNFSEFWEAGAVGFGMGSTLLPSKLAVNFKSDDLAARLRTIKKTLIGVIS